MTKKKLVKGELVGQQEFRDLIAHAIAMRGTAKPAQIAADLEYPDRQGLAATMNNMVNQGWLKRDANGFYEVSPNYETRHRRLLEMDIVDTIRRFGGLATWSEIMSAYDTLPSHYTYLPYGGRGSGMQSYLTKVMKKSDHICRYDLFEGYKMWGLKWEEMLKLPLTGRIAEFLMVFEFVDITGPAGKGGAAGEAKMR